MCVELSRQIVFVHKLKSSTALLVAMCRPTADRSAFAQHVAEAALKLEKGTRVYAFCDQCLRTSISVRIAKKFARQSAVAVAAVADRLALLYLLNNMLRQSNQSLSANGRAAHFRRNVHPPKSPLRAAHRCGPVAYPHSSTAPQDPPRATSLLAQ